MRDHLAPSFGDDPLLAEDDDLLNRAAFAARAESIVKSLPTHSSSAVVGLIGPWGSGKTSLINFMLERLKESDLRTAHFNPWIAADTPSLIHEFFQTVASALPEDSKTSWRETLSNYAKAVMPIASLVKVVGPDATGLLESLAGLADRSLEEERLALEQCLTDLDQPILIVLDDIDRLQPEELMAVFKLVRLVGRLPNIYYLIAFDERSVIDTIAASGFGNDDLTRARNYLEKMVQVRLDLPPLDEHAAADLLEFHLAGLMERLGVELERSDEVRLGDTYRAYLKQLLRQPRQVERLCAQVEAQFPLLGEEVDFVDFFAVTFLRLFRPRVIEVLQDQKERLTGNAPRLGAEPNKHEELSELITALTDADVPKSEHESVVELLGKLFPPVAKLTSAMSSGSPGPSHTEKRRIASPEYFDRYITLGIGPRDIDDRFVNDAVREAMTSPDEPDSWRDLTALVADNAEAIVRKSTRIQCDGRQAAHLLPRVAAWHDVIPTDAGFMGQVRIVHQYWCARLLTQASAASVETLGFGD